MFMGDNGIDDYKKCRQIDVDFNPHAAGAIWHDAHRQMECIRAFYHRASACAVLPRQPPWLTILNETPKH